MPRAKTSSPASPFSKLKVVELREKLKSVGLDTKGLKPDLVRRLDDFHADNKPPEPATAEAPKEIAVEELSKTTAQTSTPASTPKKKAQTPSPAAQKTRAATAVNKKTETEQQPREQSEQKKPRAQEVKEHKEKDHDNKEDHKGQEKKERNDKEQSKRNEQRERRQEPPSRAAKDSRERASTQKSATSEQRQEASAQESIARGKRKVGEHSEGNGRSTDETAKRARTRAWSPDEAKSNSISSDLLDDLLPDANDEALPAEEQPASPKKPLRRDSEHRAARHVREERSHSERAPRPSHNKQRTRQRERSPGASPPRPAPSITPPTPSDNVPASEKPPSRTLFITGFVRPFTLRDVKAVLSEKGTIVNFWMNNSKSHCFVQYETNEQAEVVRRSLYGAEWPVGNKSKLLPDFAPNEDAEKLFSGQPGVTITVAAPTQLSKASAGVHAVEPEDAASTSVTDEKPVEKLSRPLDELFKKTTTKPALYWLPVSDEAVAERLKQLQEAERPAGVAVAAAAAASEKDNGRPPR